MQELPDLGKELLNTLDKLTQSRAAIWLQGADSPGYIYCYVADERIDFLVYVDADVIGSPVGEVAAVTVNFRNIQRMFIQPSTTAPRLLALLRSAQEDHELFRTLQRKCLVNAVSRLRSMA